MGTLSLAIVSISISIAIGDGTETRSSGSEVSIYTILSPIFAQETLLGAEVRLLLWKKD